METGPSVLIIDQSYADAEQVREMLASVGKPSFNVESTPDFAEGLRRLADGGIDLVLLDLSSSDGSTAQERLERLHSTTRERIPVIVFARRSDEHAGLASVQNGAQDYLLKGDISPDLLRRSIRYAIERHRSLSVERERSARHENDLRRLREMASPGNTAVTAVAFGQGPLRSERPEAFEQLVRQYERLLELALEQAAYRVDHALSRELKNVAERLGFLFASPRDVVSIHTEALRRQVNNALPQLAQAVADEGRLMVLELMGFLASYYRTYALARTSSPPKELG